MTSLRDLLAQAGFHGQGLDTAVAVAMAESGGHVTSHNTNAGTGDNSYGLFQINMLGSLGPARLQEYHLSSNDQLFDPVTNARVAFKMSNGGTNWTPWSTYKRGDYLKYLKPGNDMQIDGTVPDGVTAAEPDPAHTGSDFDIGTGHSLTSMDQLATHRAADFAHAIGYGPEADDLGAGHGTATQTGTALPADDSSNLETFLHAATAQRGDQYVFGAKGTGQADPTQFDCSGLTQWAAHQAGVEIPAGAAHQFVDLKQKGMLIPVDKAIHTPGALLFHFASEPQPGLSGEPEIAHVAISLGNGKTIEAADPQDGVVEWNAGGGRFNYAAVIPGISDMSPADAGAAAQSLLGDANPTMDGTGTGSGLDDLGGSGVSTSPEAWHGFEHRMHDYFTSHHGHLGHVAEIDDGNYHGDLDFGH